MIARRLRHQRLARSITHFGNKEGLVAARFLFLSPRMQDQRALRNDYLAKAETPGTASTRWWSVMSTGLRQPILGALSITNRNAPLCGLPSGVIKMSMGRKNKIRNQQGPRNGFSRPEYGQELANYPPSWSRP